DATKSPGFAPLMPSGAERVSGPLPVLLSSTVSVSVFGDVRSSVATPPKAIDDLLRVASGEPTVASSGIVYVNRGCGSSTATVSEPLNGPTLNGGVSSRRVTPSEAPGAMVAVDGVPPASENLGDDPPPSRMESTFMAPGPVFLMLMIRVALFPALTSPKSTP